MINGDRENTFILASGADWQKPLDKARVFRSLARFCRAKHYNEAAEVVERLAKECGVNS